MENIAVPRFKKTDKLHRRVTDLSRQCHVTVNDEDQLVAFETTIDEAAAKVWGITDTELKVIQEARADM